ncbi:hypothetical protein HY837_03930 [archaeon]|nr:hypothetical protein [archaeon]
MLSETELQALHTNQRLLVKELQSRGITVISIEKDLELLEAEYKGHKEFLLDRDSSISPYPASIISGDKYLAKTLMRKASFSVVEGRKFCFDEVNDALVYAQQLVFPLVVKPNFGSHGNGVHMDLENLFQIKKAIDSLSKDFIIEEQFEGKEHRVFIDKNGNYAALHRDPAHVIGDGAKTIEQLAKEETERRMNPRTNCLCPVLLDDTVNIFLARSGKDLNYVPKPDEKVYLRHNSNVAVGAMCEDYTDKIHPSVIEICKRVLEVFHGLPYAGIDFLTTDVTVQQTTENYRIIEVNSVPGIHMHMHPGKGKPRNVAKYLADIIFPETK